MTDPNSAAPGRDGSRSTCIFGEYCRTHGFIHGAEAEELRSRVERILADVDHEGDDAAEALDRALRVMLDDVDARDSAAYLGAAARSLREPLETESALLEALSALLLDQPLPSGEYVHYGSCNGNRQQPVGGDGCSCPLGRRILAASRSPLPPQENQMTNVLTEWYDAANCATEWQVDSPAGGWMARVHAAGMALARDYEKVLERANNEARLAVALRDKLHEVAGPEVASAVV